MNTSVLLISLYELGRQSFGLASAAACLQQHGATPICADLAIQTLDEDDVRHADLIGLHLPMHTATRIALDVIKNVRLLQPDAIVCCFGLYAPLNATFLRRLGVDVILSAEFEDALVDLYKDLLANGTAMVRESRSEHQSGSSLPKQRFQLPHRQLLPKLNKYAFLDKGDGIPRVVGYTETTRGCKHLCRHCPIVPVYNGALRVVQKGVVLADIRQQIEAGAQHITFGDPDFLNGPGHSLPIVEALHDEFPDLTFDVTIKVEHLLQHAKLLPRLKQSGCLFITSAVESFDDWVLEYLDKGHTYADFLSATQLCRQNEIFLQPTFVAFHPWLSIDSYISFLSTVTDLELISAIPPIQYAIRLLIPAHSRLLELNEIQTLVDEFDDDALVYPWVHRDPNVDILQQQLAEIIHQGEQAGESRRRIFERVWNAATLLSEDRDVAKPLPSVTFAPDAVAIPKLSEHWYC